MTDLDDPACLGHDPGYWDTVTRGGHTSRLGTVKIKSGRIPRMTQIAIAKSVCSTCPAKAQCLAAGMNQEEGIWGGTLPDERRHTQRF